MKKCNGCPILITSNQGDINGNECLPSYSDVKKWYKDTGKVWACHENNTKPCVGFIIKIRRDGVPLSLNNTTILITEDMKMEEIYVDD